MEKWFLEQSQCRVLYRTLHRLIHTTCLVLAAMFWTRTQHWRVRYCTKYTFWIIFCVLFHYSTLSGCKNTNMKALISVHLAYYAPGESNLGSLWHPCWGQINSWASGIKYSRYPRCEWFTPWLCGVHAEAKKHLSFENTLWQTLLCEVGAKAEGTVEQRPAAIINSSVNYHCLRSVVYISV